MADTLREQPPDGSACWSTRAMADRWGVGKDIVARVWRERGLRPWRADVFKLSQNLDFEGKLCDVIGLYLDPPERAAVFSFDEKTQIQALDRTQPSLPMKRGRAQTMTHDYKRNGTLDLFAALNVATGEVLHQTRKRRTGKDVLAFFERIDLHTPATSTSTSSWTSQRPQVQARQRLARPPPARALAPALHPHQHKLGQPRRGLVLHTHPQSPQRKGIHLRRPTRRRHRTLDRPLEPRPQTPPLDQNRPTHPRQNQTSTNSTQPRKQTRDTPLVVRR